MTVANFVTLLRIAMIPIFGVLWCAGHYAEALGIFVLAGLSDLADGLFARVLDQRSVTGAILDPAADKLMLLVSFLVAASVGAVPWWLAAIVIARDVILSGGVALVLLVFGERLSAADLHPTRIGKCSTFFQLLTILLALVARATERSGMRQWVGALVLITAAFTITSGLQYVVTTIAFLLDDRRGKRGGEGRGPLPIAPAST